jgi:hypothetical protein
MTHYLPGTYGHEAQGRRLRIFESWNVAQARVAAGESPYPWLHGDTPATAEELAQEAMSVSDFGTYMGKLFRHSFLDRFQEIAGRFQDYTRPMTAPDFEDYTSSRFGRFPNIPEKAPGGPYQEIALKELPGPTINLREFGAAFKLTRRLILSDRLDKIADLPTRFAEAFARTKSTIAAVNTLQANPTMWDGNALFSAQHANTGTTALTADFAGMNALIAADQALSDQVDDEGYPIVTPSERTLVIPTELRWIVEAIRQNPTLLNGVNYVANLAQSLVANVIVEPYLTDANNWYLLSDPTGELSPIAAVTLNGETIPFIGRKDAEVTSLQGGTDPYTFDFDQLEFKGRDDYNFIAIEWRGSFGSIVP